MNTGVDRGIGVGARRLLNTGVDRRIGVGARCFLNIGAGRRCTTYDGSVRHAWLLLRGRAYTDAQRYGLYLGD